MLSQSLDNAKLAFFVEHGASCLGMVLPTMGLVISHQSSVKTTSYGQLLSSGDSRLCQADNEN